MKGDISRSTFDPHKHYSSVRMQQGRVQLDADWNEQVDILRHLLISHATDIVGQAGGIAGAFKVAVGPQSSDEMEQAPAVGSRPLPAITINSGRYYVEGVLCESDGEPGSSLNLLTQPDLPVDAVAEELKKLGQSEAAVVYLDVWQRHVTMVEDPDLQEIALGGIDTTTRSKTVWQARLLPVDQDSELARAQWDEFKQLQKQRGRLEVKQTGTILENQLYRVEVHALNSDGVILKWAPDNASTVVPIASIKHQPEPVGGEDHETWTFVVGDLPTSVGIGDCLELEDDSSSLSGHRGPLAEVADINRQEREITIKLATEHQVETGSLADHLDLSQHPLLRRWEKVVRSESGNWTDLNGVVKVCLVAAHDGEQSVLRPGDFWWIPVRADPAPSGAIDWPNASDKGVPPHGIEHHYAPLALVHWTAEGGWKAEDWRPEFFPLVDTARQLQAYQQATNEKLQALQEDAEQRLNQFGVRLQELQSLIAGGVEAALERSVNRTSLQNDFRAKDMLEKGHVVALAVAREAEVAEKAEQLIGLASSEDPTLILGVVARAPSFPTAETRYTVTLNGLATCLVTGRVDPGDLLVPSGLPGYARRAGLYIRPGTVIGKALSSHDPNPEAPDLTGEINILVMLG